MRETIVLLLCLFGASNGARCTDIEGTLKQVDAGNGLVFGVNPTGAVYTRLGQAWVRVPGNLKHVTVGPSGVWGVGQRLDIFRLVAGQWSPIFNAQLVQIDAGGAQFVAGVDQFGATLCLEKNELPKAVPNGTVAFRSVGSRMKYYSCGPLGCWGVTLAKDVYYRINVTPSACLGTGWSRIFGKFQMIEVGTDGRVFAISVTKQLYMRKGITSNKPTGWGWTKIQIGNLRFKHASWDMGLLWLVRDDGRIVRCSSQDIY
uniref:fish-egg lectin-like n=1 Tax=Pristiophorus japonicus TaxID=55135 RepID=UPI00398E5FCD